MLKLCFAVAALGLCAAPAFAQEAQPEEPKKEKRICKREPTLGTRIKTQRICMTRAEWDELESETQRSLRKQKSWDRTGDRIEPEPR